MQAKWRTKYKTTRLIPPSLWKRSLKALRNFLNYTEEIIHLPHGFVFAYSCFVGSSFTGALLLSTDKQLWNLDGSIGKILYPLSFVWRLGALFDKDNQIMISSIVCIITSLLVIAYLAVLTPIYSYYGRIPYMLCWITSFCNDFVMPTLFLWMSSQIGTLCASIYIHFKVSGVFNYFFLIISAILLVFIIVGSLYTHVFLYPLVVYSKSRTITWIGNLKSTLANLVYAVLAFTRLTESIIEPTLKLCMMIACLILAIVYYIYFLIHLPFINYVLNLISIVTITTSIIILILQIIRAFIIEINDSIVAFSFMVIESVLMLVYHIILRKREIRALSCLNLLATNDIQWEDTFKSRLSFLYYMRVGFVYGNPYVLSWIPFQKAIEKWPNVYHIWIQYLRFICIYQEQTNTVASLEAQMKEKFKSMNAQGFCFHIRKTINSRNRHMSKEIKNDFQRIDENIRFIKNLLVTYWSSIEECNAGSTYDIGNQLQYHFEEVESGYLHLVLLYPNNPIVCGAFAKFYSDLRCDKMEAKKWKLRQTQLESRAAYLDITQEAAFDTFPLLPHTMNEVYAQLDLSTTARVGGPNTTQTALSDTVPQTTEGSLSQSQQSQEEEDLFSGSLRQLADEAPMNVIRDSSIIAVVFCIIFYLIGIFMPSFIVLEYISKFTDSFNGVVTSSFASRYIMRYAVNLIKLAYGLSGTLLTRKEEQIYLIHDINEIPDYGTQIDTLNELALKLNEYVSEFVSIMNDLVSLDSESGRFLYQEKIEMKHHTYDPDGSSREEIYQSPLIESLTAYTGFVYQFDFKTNRNFSNDLWFTQVITNSFPISETIAHFNDLLCDDVVKTLDKLNRTITIVISILIILSLVYSPLFIFSIHRIQKQWNNLVKALNSLPHVSIQSAISSFTGVRKDDAKKQDEKIEKILKTESKYTNVFIQMVSSRDIKNGLPIYTLIGMSIVNVLFLVASYIIILIFVPIQSQKVFPVPYRFAMPTNYMIYLFNSALLLFRRVALDSNETYWTDTKQLIDEKLNTALVEMSPLLTRFLFGQTDDIDVGIFASTSQDVEQLFIGKEDWLTDNNEHNRLMNTPPFLLLDILNEMFVTAYLNCKDPNYTASRTDDNLLLYTHMVIEHIPQDVFIPISKILSNIMNQTMSNLLTIVFLVSGIFFVVGSFLLISFLTIYKQILRTVRFCLSSLTMIKYHFIKDSPYIMSLYSGNFSSVSIENNSIMPALIVVENEAPDAIVILDESMKVTSFNKSALELFKLDDATRDLFLHSMIKFEDPQVLSSISALIKSHDSNVTTEFHTNVSAINSNEQHPETVSLIRVEEERKPVQVIILMIHQNEVRNKLDEIRIIENQINEIKAKVVPERMKEKYNQSNNAITTFHNGFIICIEQCDFNEFIKNKSQAEIKQRIISFHKIVDDVIQEYSNSFKLRDFGTSVIICFNVIKQQSNMFDVTSDILSFCRMIGEKARDCGMEVRGGVSYDKTSRGGILSEERPSYDMFSLSINYAQSLSHNAQPFTIIPNNRVLDIISAEEIKNTLQVSIQVLGLDNEWFRSIAI